MRLGAAAGGLGLGQDRGDAAGIGRGDLRRYRGGQAGCLGDQLREPPSAACGPSAGGGAAAAGWPRLAL